MIEISRRFVAETSYEVTFDESMARHHLGTYLSVPHLCILLGEQNGIIVGGAMLALSYEFQSKPFGYVSKFFVLPEGRGLGIGRALVDAMLHWFTEKGASHVFVTATAGLSDLQQRLFVSLMKRHGFTDSGPVMCLKLGNQ